MRLDPGDIDILRREMRQLLAEVMEDLRRQDGKLGYSEAEAANLLSIKRHVLRDCRLRGEIRARRVGRSWRYSVDELRRFLEGEGR